MKITEKETTAATKDLIPGTVFRRNGNTDIYMILSKHGLPETTEQGVVPCVNFSDNTYTEIDDDEHVDVAAAELIVSK